MLGRCGLTLIPVISADCLGEVPTVPVLPRWIPVTPSVGTPGEDDPAIPKCPVKLWLKEDAGPGHSATTHIVSINRFEEPKLLIGKKAAGIFARFLRFKSEGALCNAHFKPPGLNLIFTPRHCLKMTIYLHILNLLLIMA